MLPPLSEQKVISQPSPDENALSISLNTLPGKKTLAVRIGWGINSNNRKTLHRLYFTESLARLLANTKLAHLSVVAGCSSPCQSWVMVVVMNCMEKRTRLSLLRSPLNFSGLYRNAKNWWEIIRNKTWNMLNKAFKQWAQTFMSGFYFVNVWMHKLISGKVTLQCTN